MKKISLLIVIILSLYVFTSVHAGDDDKSFPHPNECISSLSSYTRAFKTQVAHLALQNSIEEAGNKLNVPISIIPDLVDSEISVILKNIIEEEIREGRVSIISLSYWAVVNRKENEVIELQRARVAIDITAEKLGVPGSILLHWLAHRDVQLYLMRAIARRLKESDISDWVYEYRVEMGKLQFPSRHVMSLVYGDGRDHIVALALENGVEETAKDLNIPHAIISLLISDRFRQKRNVEMRGTEKAVLSIGGKEIVVDIEKNMDIEDITMGLGIHQFTLWDWLRLFLSYYRNRAN